MEKSEREGAKMKSFYTTTTTITILLLTIISSIAVANPFLICDPQEGVIAYEISGLPDWYVTRIPAENDGSIKLDLATLPIDNTTYELQVRACNVWGCSDPAPFSFTTSTPPVPTQFRLMVIEEE